VELAFENDEPAVKISNIDMPESATVYTTKIYIGGHPFLKKIEKVLKTPHGFSGYTSVTVEYVESNKILDLQV